MITLIIILLLSFIVLIWALKFRQKKLNCKDGVCSIESAHSTPVKVKENIKTRAVIELTYENFEQIVLKATKPVIIDFYANWCPPCKEVKPIYNQLALEKTDWVFTALNVDIAPEIMDKCGVKAMPTFVVFKNGIQYGLIEGVMPKEKLVSEFQKMINVKLPVEYLIRQISNKDIEGIKNSINDGVDLNGVWTTPYGNFFPLKTAVVSGNKEIIDLLLNSGAIFNKEVEQKISSEIQVHENGIEAFRQTFQYAKNKIQALQQPITQEVKLTGPELRQEFMLGMSDFNKLEEVINKGADVNYIFKLDKVSITPIYFAIMINNIPAIDLLIESGATLQVEIADEFGNKKTIEVLIEDYIQHLNSEIINSRNRLNYLLQKY